MTGTLADAVAVAHQLQVRFALGGISPGLLAFALVAVPGSAAERSLRRGTGLNQYQLLELLHENVVGTHLEHVHHILPKILAQSASARRQAAVPVVVTALRKRGQPSGRDVSAPWARPDRRRLRGLR